MRRVLFCLVVAMALGLGACDFARGFRNEGARQLADITIDELDHRLDGKLGGIKDAVNGVASQIPKDKNPAEEGLLYSAGALLAYIVGSYGKGKVREMREKGKETT